MSDQQRATVVRNKLVMKDLANLKEVGKTLTEGGDPVCIGDVWGRATGFVNRTTETGEPVKGLKGEFEGVPSDPERLIVRSGVCFLPETMFSIIEAQLANILAPDDKGNEPVNPVLGFGFRVWLDYTPHGAGYKFSFQPMMQPETDDPLERMKQEVLGTQPERVAISDQSENEPQEKKVRRKSKAQ